MNRAVIFCGLVALASGLAWADAIVLSSGESLVNMPASISNPGPGTNCGVTGNASGNCGTLGTGPYWDNLSGDGNQLNGGYFLTGTGGFGGGTNYMPGQYLSQSNGSGQADQPTDITLDHTTSAATATLLLNDTNNTDDVFGYYNTGTMAETALFGPGSLSGDIGGSNNLTNLLNSEDYGFYLTRCLVYVSGFSGACSQYTTWFSNDALDTTDAGHQHFAIFTSPTTGI